MAPTQKGVSPNPDDWLSVDSLHKLAVKNLHESVDEGLSPELDRVDIRPSRGIVKFVFTNHYWGLQLDCTSRHLLLIEKRNSGLIEDIPDGTIPDRLFGTGEKSMVWYTTIMGISLVMLTLTGFWLWYGPKELRKMKKKIKLICWTFKLLKPSIRDLSHNLYLLKFYNLVQLLN